MSTDKEIKKLERRIDTLRARDLMHQARRKKTALRRVFAVVKKFGFDSIHELLEIADTAVVASTKTKKGKRTKITPVLRKAIIADLKRDKESALIIAKRHGVSQPSVNVIKKAAGLTKSRKKVKAVEKSPPKKAKAVKKVKLLKAVPPTPEIVASV